MRVSLQNSQPNSADDAHDAPQADNSPGESLNTPAQVNAVTALLRGEEPNDDAPQGDDDSASRRSGHESAKKGAPKNFADMAERLGCKESDLYAIEFPAAADGAPRKLGELKDLLARQDTIAIAELKSSETQRKREADFLRAQSELDELLSQLPKEALKPEVVNAARKRREVHVERERARTLEAIPEWGDDERKGADVAGMSEFLNAYGFQKNFLMSVVDHRSLKLIRDFWQLTQRVDRALAAAKEVAPRSAQRPSGKASNAPQPKEKPAPLTSRSAQVSAVAQLIGATNGNKSVSR